MNLYEKYMQLAQQEGSIKVMENPTTGLVTFSKLHSGVDFSNPLYRMARGLTLTKEGHIVLRGFEKFFNYLELELYDTYTEGFKDEFSRLNGDKTKEVIVQDKLDGTMVLVSVYEGELVIGTTSSTKNVYTDKLQGYFNLERFSSIKRYLEGLDEPHTLIFEYISPFNQVVVLYDAMDLVLLGQVNNQTGKLTSVQGVQTLAGELGVSKPELYTYTVDELVGLQQTLVDTEGFIAINEYGRLIKFKTQYWFDQSRKIDIFFSNQITSRLVGAILGSYIKDELDDLIAYQNQHQVFKEYDMIGRIMNPIKELWGQVDDYYAQFKQLEQGSTYKTAVMWLEDELREHVHLKSLVYKKLKNHNNKPEVVGNFYLKYLLAYYDLDEDKKYNQLIHQHKVRQLTKLIGQLGKRG